MSSSDPRDLVVTLRFAFPDDDTALARMARLDDSRPLGDPVLVAEVDGELRAALSLTDGQVIADPFHHTAELVHLLRARASQLTRPAPSRGTRGAWLLGVLGPRRA